MYDYQGRPALQSLSAPQGTSFGYNPNFILVQNITTSTENPYQTSNFDTNDNILVSVSPNTPNTLGYYYSTNNSSNPYQDITNYPFSRTVFSKLNPGTVKKVLGGNKVNGQWLQSYQFTMPASQELSKPNAFGSISYNYKRISKTVIRDVNGIETVVFTDSDGNTLAAAHSGNEENSSLQTYEMTSTIKEQGYVDIHIPVGCYGVTLTNPSGIFIKRFDLVNESYIGGTSNTSEFINIGPGIYRFAVSNADSYEYDPFNKITLRYNINYYDYSLNKFDKAGRLLSSSQPLGQNIKSTFSYNSLGQVLETSSPDEGTANFKYRTDGQIRYSQNSKQASNREFSYTSYDNLGRPIESGVLENNSFDMANPDVAALPSGTKKEQHFTFYDVPHTGLNFVLANLNENNIPSWAYNQTFLSSNVSATYNVNPYTNTTWYSYDVYGRVKWILQYIQDLGIKTIDYTYDPVTGQVTKVDYQRYVASERFVHKYDYNDAGQLVTVSTSGDDVNFTINAEYQYSETGQLIRTELAEDLQGIDYVYNLNGQLKAINSPQNTGFVDPGNDDPSTNGFKPDVFGMIIDYHQLDFNRHGNYLTGLVNASTNAQLNGNIGSIRWNNNTPTSNQIDTYKYGYNKNNWLSLANFGSSSLVPGIKPNSFFVNFTEDLNEDYKVSNISYDANGNLKTLKRNGFTGGGSNDMDEFTYHYKDQKNQLTSVEDTNDNSDPNRYDDLKNQFTSPSINNYIYNSIGQLIVNNQDNISYEYNASGLVTQINELSDIDNGEWSTIYIQDFGQSTFADANEWTSSNGSTSIYNGNYTSQLEAEVFEDCDVLSLKYGKSLGVFIPTTLVLPGTLVTTDVTHQLSVIEGKLHQLNLDAIVKQQVNNGLLIIDGGTYPNPCSKTL